MAESLLSLRGFGAAFDDSVALSEVNVDIRPGMNVLMGPAGGGSPRC